MTSDVIKAGFRKSGIHPVNRMAVPDSKLKVSRRAESLVLLYPEEPLRKNVSTSTDDLQIVAGAAASTSASECEKEVQLLNEGCSSTQFNKVYCSRCKKEIEEEERSTNLTQYALDTGSRITTFDKTIAKICTMPRWQKRKFQENKDDVHQDNGNNDSGEESEDYTRKPDPSGKCITDGNFVERYKGYLEHKEKLEKNKIERKRERVRLAEEKKRLQEEKKREREKLRRGNRR